MQSGAIKACKYHAGDLLKISKCSNQEWGLNHAISYDLSSQELHTKFPAKLRGIYSEEFENFRLYCKLLIWKIWDEITANQREKTQKRGSTNVSPLSSKFSYMKWMDIGRAVAWQQP